MSGAWSKRRATFAKIPEVEDHSGGETRAERAAQWRVDEARRRAILAGASDLGEMTSRLVRAGELCPTTAASLQGQA
jgi:hypothetical protein